MHNIEKSAFRRGEYVGYAHGVWHIRKSTSSYGNWVARHRDDLTRPVIFAFRLSDMSDKLAALAAPVQVDTETAYGSSVRLSRSITVF